MKHCEKCNIDVESNLSNCPLCGAYIGGSTSLNDKNNNAYREDIRTMRSRRILLKIAGFVSILASIVCLIVDMSVNGKLIWSMHLVTAIVGAWLVVLCPIFWRIPMRKQLAIDMLVGIAVVFYAEYFAHTTSHWGFHLGLPIVLMSTLSLYALMMIIDHRRWRDYAMTVTPISVLAIIPIFISLGVFHEIRWAWYVTTGIAAIMIVSFFIFGKRGYIEELKKRLHF